MSNELREKIASLLDFFTEPSPKEKYLRDLENDLLALLEQEIIKARLDEAEKSMRNKWSKFINEDQVLINLRYFDDRIAQLTQLLEGSKQ